MNISPLTKRPLPAAHYCALTDPHRVWVLDHVHHFPLNTARALAMHRPTAGIRTRLRRRSTAPATAAACTINGGGVLCRRNASERSNQRPAVPTRGRARGFLA